MSTQIHKGSGDNVARNKYETIIHSVQTRDLKTVVDDIMRDVCYRDMSIAIEKLNTLKNIDSLDCDVKSLLNVIQLKIELNKGSVLSDKKELLGLLRSQNLPVDVRDVVTSILIDFESRTDSSVARTRYDSADTNNVYVKEVFFERLASREEIHEQFENSTKNDLLDQELAGLIRGSLRVEEFKLAVDISRFLNINFPSKNSKALLVYSKSCLLVTKNHHYFTLNKQAKDDVDELIIQLTACLKSGDPRYIFSLINLLNISFFADRRLIELGAQCVEKIRDIDERCADTLQNISSLAAPATRFELTSSPLDLDDLMDLHSSIEGDLVKLSAVNSWLDNGGDIQTGDGYIDSFAKLLLRARVCSHDDKQGVLSLGVKAKEFFELDKVRILELNPFAIIELCEKFIELDLPLNAVEYLSCFLPEESWVSPLFECYINALIASEKYELFLSKTKHLLSVDKTFIVWMREAQLYERTGNYKLCVEAVRSAIKISPNNHYAWHLLLRVSRKEEKSAELLREIIFEIPEEVFLRYHESKVPLVNEIATFIDLNIADRILVDWFVKEPDVVAYAISQIYFNSLNSRPEVTISPYIPNHCCDGVTYTDGFDKFSHILVTGIETSHASLLDVESPKGLILNRLKIGETYDDPAVGEITLLERLPPYVAALRLATKLRNKSNDGTDAFKIFTVPSNEEDFIPYLKKVLKRYSNGDRSQAIELDNPNISLVIRGKYTDPDNPVKGAFNHLTLENSTQHMSLFNEGVERPVKVIIDVNTAVYFALIGLVPGLKKLSLEVVFTEQTKVSLELWIKNVLREDYLTLDLTEHGIQRRTSEDIKRDSLEYIEELQELVEYSKVEPLTPSDTPDEFIKIRDVMDETVYSTFQLSVANNIPLLCIDHIMCSLSYHSGHPVANMHSLLMELLDSSSLEVRKKGIQFNLLRGTPLPILYRDIVELSRSTDSLDVFYVAKFIEKYGAPKESLEVILNFLVGIVGQVTGNAFLNGEILNGGRCKNPYYDGYAELVFNLCCREAIKVVSGETAEQRLALFLSSLCRRFAASREYSLLISKLASTFARGHFLNIQEINKAFATHNRAQSKAKNV